MHLVERQNDHNEAFHFVVVVVVVAFERRKIDQNAIVQIVLIMIDHLIILKVLKIHRTKVEFHRHPPISMIPFPIKSVWHIGTIQLK